MNTEKVIKIGQSQVINLPRGFHLYKFETTIIVIPKRQWLQYFFPRDKIHLQGEDGGINRFHFTLPFSLLPCFLRLKPLLLNCIIWNMKAGPDHDDDENIMLTNITVSFSAWSWSAYQDHTRFPKPFFGGQFLLIYLYSRWPMGWFPAKSLQ